jgi:predicted kinase
MNLSTGWHPVIRKARHVPLAAMELIVFAGLPGAGKTTFYRERFLATHVRIGLDLLKTREREDILLHACFAAKQPVVIDNTNPLAAQRMRYASLAKAAGFRSALYFFDVTTRLAVGRNSGRADKERVPNVAIFGTQKKMQRPTRAEGFDQIFRVTTGDEQSSAFMIEEWRDE